MAKLSDEQRVELATALAEAQARGMSISLPKGRDNKSSTWGVGPSGYFPRRTGQPYNPNPKQAGFIASKARFVGFAGSRGCLAPETKISGVPVAERSSCGTVQTLMGDAFAFPSYCKGVDDLYKVVTQSGAEVVATGNHRFLTPFGWLPLNQLQVGDLVCADGTANEVYSMGIPKDSLDGYPLYFRLYDELCILSEQVALNILQQLHTPDDDNSAWQVVCLPSIVDSLSRMLSRLYVELQVSQVSYESCLVSVSTFFQSLCSLDRSNISESGRLEELLDTFLIGKRHLEDGHLKFGEFESRSFCDDGGYQPRSEYYDEFGKDQISLSNLDSWQTWREYLGLDMVSFQLPENSEYSVLRPSSEDVYDLRGISHRSFSRFEFPVGIPGLGSSQYSLKDFGHVADALSRFCVQGPKKSLDHSLSLLRSSFLEFVGLLSRDLHFEVCQISSSLSLINSQYYNHFFDKVQCISYDRTGEYYDLTVPEYAHYSAQGLYHHNSGKTAAGAQKAIHKIREGKNGAILNPDFQNFVDSTWPEIRDWIPWDMVVPAQRVRQNADWVPHKPFQLVFTNGAVVICKGLKDPDAARGPNINWLWYDEATRDLDGMSWKLAIASVRVGDQPQAWATFTPRGLEHWTYKLFVKRDISQAALDLFAEMETRELVDMFHATIDENKENLDAGYYASLLAAYPDGWLKRQEIEGEFVEMGGILGNPAWFKNRMIFALPDDVVLKGIVRYWDLAASEKKIAGKRSDDPDKTVGTLMGWDGYNFYILDQVSGYWDYEKLKSSIVLTAQMDGPLVPIYIEQEPGSGGKNQVADIAKTPELLGYSVRAHKAEGDKVMRANIWFAEAQAGRIFLKQGDWVTEFLEQLSSFPISRHDDHIDSVSGARLCIAPIRRWSSGGGKFLAVTGNAPKSAGTQIPVNKGLVIGMNR